MQMRIKLRKPSKNVKTGLFIGPELSMQAKIPQKISCNSSIAIL